MVWYRGGGVGGVSLSAVVRVGVSNAREVVRCFAKGNVTAAVY